MGTLMLRLLIAGCVLAPAVTAAQPRSDLEDEDANTKLWREVEAKLPPYPRSANIIPFEVSAASTNRFYIDPESISVGSDGVVRYTVVVRSADGAENISYEGIRCETREQRYYAFGRRDGTWANARSDAWRYIESKDINRQHGVLYLEYFCPDKRKPLGSPKDIINRFKYGVPAKSIL